MAVDKDELHSWQRKPFNIFDALLTRTSPGLMTSHEIVSNLTQGELRLSLNQTNAAVMRLRMRAGLLCTFNQESHVEYYHLPDEQRGVQCTLIDDPHGTPGDHMWGYYDHSA